MRVSDEGTGAVVADCGCSGIRQEIADSIKSMPAPVLSQDQEQRLVDALVSLGWMMEEGRKSCELISHQLGCTKKDAVDVLDYIPASSRATPPQGRS